MSQAELAEAIPWEAEQYIPFDLSEVQLDYQVVNSERPTRRKSGLDVLLVAAQARIASTTAPASSRRPAAGRSCSTSRRSRWPTPIR